MLNTITAPYGYTPIHATVSGALFTVLGVIGSIVFSMLLDKHQCYLKIMRIIIIGTMCFTALEYYSLPSGNPYILIVNTGLAGFFLVPIKSVGLSLSAEVTFPVSDSLSAGLMMMTQQILSTAVSYFVTYLIVDLG